MDAFGTVQTDTEKDSGFLKEPYILLCEECAVADEHGKNLAMQFIALLFTIESDGTYHLTVKERLPFS
mgnify:FL=1